MKFLALILVFSMALICNSCKTGHSANRANIEDNFSDVKIETSKSVTIPQSGAPPIAGLAPVEAPSRTVSFTNIGEKLNVKTGEIVNIIYDGIDPENTYIVYESTPDGYILELAPKNETKVIEFSRLCQTFVVLSPDRTLLKVPETLKYEQIIWTPRADGSWEVRLGSQERGCQSPALNEINKLRTKEYNKKTPR